MTKKTIKVDRHYTITIAGQPKRVKVEGQQEIDWPESINDCVTLFGSEKAVLAKLQEIYRIRKQDALARRLALEIVAPERALMKEQAEKIKKLAQTLQEKGLSLEDVEKLISNL